MNSVMSLTALSAQSLTTFREWTISWNLRNGADCSQIGWGKCIQSTATSRRLSNNYDCSRTKSWSRISSTGWLSRRWVFITGFPGANCWGIPALSIPITMSAFSSSDISSSQRARGTISSDRYHMCLRIDTRTLRTGSGSEVWNEQN